ncbi:MAG TPA: hypothetical protein VEK56_10220 [Vicinamibacterales bacterium]|nr:hypothetical protein [Vicinamibacterales bacterium]
MSVNLGTYALVTALALGGVAAQQKYSQPADPSQTQQNNTTAQSGTQPMENGYTGTPSGPTAPVECNTLMTHHQQMMQDLDRMDEQANTLVSQMKDAKNDHAKLEATATAVETLVTQRKDMRDRMTSMEHETLQFLLTNKSTDLTTSCPQLSQWLQQGADMQNTTAQGGPDDAQIYNDQNTQQNQDNATKPDNQQR